jgi:hypothetical protein
LVTSLCIGVVVGAQTWGAEPMDVGYELASNLPPWFSDYLRSARELDSYALEGRVNPFYFQADFNGDGTPDIVIFLREKVSGKRGLLVVHGATNAAYILAAGADFDGRGDDFSRFDAWRVYPRGPIPRSVHARSDAPTLQGDALYMQVLESSSGIIYWAGEEYAWYQQGD